MISICGFHLSGLKIGELGSLLHEIAYGALERLEAPLGGRPQRVLHLHCFEHDERRAPRHTDSRFGENARHPSRHWRDDTARRSRLRGICNEWIASMQIEAAARRGYSKIAACPCHRYPLGRVAEAHVEYGALARRELQAIGPTAEVQPQAVAGVPQHRVVAFGSLAKAQGAAAPAGERPAVA